jgi:hypothetical protein
MLSSTLSGASSTPSFESFEVSPPELTRSRALFGASLLQALELDITMSQESAIELRIIIRWFSSVRREAPHRERSSGHGTSPALARD